jgi:hypothetical protein
MALRAFKNRQFQRFMKAEELSDELIWIAVDEVENGLVDGRLGGFILKKRIAREGRGKSKGYRTILAHRQGERIFFLYGFAKNEADNIDKKELSALRELGDEYMKLSDEKLNLAIKNSNLLELK